MCAPLHNLATERVGAEPPTRAEATEKVWHGAPGWQRSSGPTWSWSIGGVGWPFKEFYAEHWQRYTQFAHYEHL